MKLWLGLSLLEENPQNELGGRVTRQCGVSQTASDALDSKREILEQIDWRVIFLEYFSVPLTSVAFSFIVAHLINGQWIVVFMFNS